MEKNEAQISGFAVEQKSPSSWNKFWSNPYKLEVMITSPIEMLGLPNFGQVTTSTI